MFFLSFLYFCRIMCKISNCLLANNLLRQLIAIRLEENEMLCMSRYIIPQPNLCWEAMKKIKEFNLNSVVVNV